MRCSGPSPATKRRCRHAIASSIATTPAAHAAARPSIDRSAAADAAAGVGIAAVNPIASRSGGITGSTAAGSSTATSVAGTSHQRPYAAPAPNARLTGTRSDRTSSVAALVASVVSQSSAAASAVIVDLL